MPNNILITGTSSGLGKMLLERLDGIAFNRAKEIKDYTENTYDAIIHCAYNTGKVDEHTDLVTYLNNTLNLTKDLLTLSYKKFIFLSTLDVYPKNSINQIFTEETTIDPNQICSIYGITKFFCEKLILSQASNVLILRPSALLGEHSRSNSLFKLLNNEPNISLSGSSEFNYVLHEDVAEFIKQALYNNLSGIYNITAQSNISLNEIKKRLNLNTQFGDFIYKTPKIDNKKAVNILPNLSKTSLDNIYLYAREY